MKKIISSLFLLILLLGFLSTVSAAGFRDIPKNYWAEEEIEYLISKNIIAGYSDATFRPNDKLSRIQIALMIQRAKGYSETNRPNPNLTDIKPGSKYYSLVSTLMDEGLFSNLVKNRKFEPSKTVTRAEMASILAKAYNLSGISDKRFYDVPGNHWAYKFVQALAANDITYGITETSFGPTQDVNRVQFSAFLARTLNESFRPLPDNSRTNPIPMGEVWEVKVDDWYDGSKRYEIGMVDAIVDGEVAWQMIKDTNMFNDPPPLGKKYVLAKFYYKLIDSEKESINVNYLDFEAVSENGVVYDYPSVVVPEPELWVDLYKGGAYEGWAAFLVEENDNPVIVWQRDHDDELWFQFK